MARVPRRLARGTSAEVAAYTGPTAEPIVNTETWRLHVQDGATAGGRPLALLSDVVVDLTRAQIPSRSIPLNAFRTSGDTAQGDAGAGALYVRGTSGGLRAIQDASGTWWNLAIPHGLAKVGWFGAKSDGVTNDTAAVNAAVAAFPFGGGGIVEFPVGVTLVSGLANIPADIALVGVSRSKSILRTNSATASVIVLDGSRAMVHNLTIDAAVTRTAGSFIAATTNCSRILIKGVDLVGPFIGVYLPYPSIAIAHIIDVDIVDAVPLTGTSIQIDGGFVVLMDGVICRLSSYAGARPFAHVSVKHVEDLVINNTQLIGADVNLNLAPPNGRSVNLVRSHNTIYDFADSICIRIAPDAGGAVFEVVIDSPWIKGDTHDVLATDVGGGAVESIKIVNSLFVGTGIGFQAVGVNYAALIGSSIGQHTDAVVFTDVYGGIISNNVIGPHGLYGPNNQGILLTGTTDKTVVSSNIVLNNTTANISNTASGTNTISLNPT